MSEDNWAAFVCSNGHLDIGLDCCNTTCKCERQCPYCFSNSKKVKKQQTLKSVLNSIPDDYEPKYIKHEPVCVVTEALPEAKRPCVNTRKTIAVDPVKKKRGRPKGVKR